MAIPFACEDACEVVPPLITSFLAGINCVYDFSEGGVVPEYNSGLIPLCVTFGHLLRDGYVLAIILKLRQNAG